MNQQLGDLFKIDRATITQGEFGVARAVRAKVGLPDEPSEIEAFIILNSSGKLPLEIVHQQIGSKDAIPVSVRGKTQVRFVGETPMISSIPDQNNNMEMIFVGPGAVEVTFNSRSRAGRHPKEKIKLYIIE